MKFTEVKKEVQWLIALAAIAIGATMIVTFAEDIATLGAGVADDLSSFIASLALGAAILNACAC